MKTQHKSKRKALRRGKQDYSCARAFYFECNRDIEKKNLRDATHVNGSDN